MTLELELAIRFIRRRSGTLLRGTALAAFAGVAVSTAALVITLALMNGYRGAIAVALQRGNAHLVGFAPGSLSLAEARELAQKLGDADGVVRALPVTYLPALLDDPAEPTSPLPVVLKAVAEPPAFTGLSRWPAGNEVPAIVGERLAHKGSLVPGSIAEVRLPPRRGAWILPALALRCAGTFRLGFAEFDERWVVVPLDAVLTRLPETGVGGVEVELEDPMLVDRVRPVLEELAPRLVLTDWREMNRPLFAALRWQTISLFLVLSLVVTVASFQVSSALVVLAIDKRRTTGMLQALGATASQVRRVLMLSGALLGGAGVASGLALGWLASVVMSALRVVRFPEGLARVYMVDHIPFVFAPLHAAAVLGVCSVLVLIASWWPAWRSSRLDPVAALKAV